MEHKRLEELTHLADLKPAQTMTRRERLDRWIALLEIQPDRIVRTLNEIEHRAACERRAMRSEGSALSIAFADPVLRSAGLESDRYGDAVAFFELSDHDAHVLLCSCHVGASMRAGEAARRLRRISAPSIWSRWFGL